MYNFNFGIGQRHGFGSLGKLIYQGFLLRYTRGQRVHLCPLCFSFAKFMGPSIFCFTRVLCRLGFCYSVVLWGARVNGLGLLCLLALRVGYTVVLLVCGLASNSGVGDVSMEVASTIVTLVVVTYIFSSYGSGGNNSRRVAEDGRIVTNPIAATRGNRTAANRRAANNRAATTTATTTTGTSSSLGIPSIAAPSFGGAASTDKGDTTDSVNSLNSTILNTLTGTSPRALTTFMGGVNFNCSTRRNVFCSLVSS